MLFGFIFLTCAFLLSSHFLPWTSFQQELAAAVSAIVIGVTALAKPGAWRWPWIAVAAAVAALIPMAQAAAGLLLYPIDGLLASLYLLGFALCIAVGSRLVTTRRDDLLDGLAGVMLTAALVSVGLAACQWLHVSPPLLELMPMAPGGRPFGNLAQPNHLATLLILGLIGAAWLYQRVRIGVGVLAVAATFLCIGVALTQSRQVWIAAIVLALWIAFVRRKSDVKVASWAMPAFGLLLVVAIAVLAPLNEMLEVSAGRSVKELAHGGTRLLHWQTMIDAILRAPWFGYGWNEMAVAQSVVARDHPASYEMIDHSHNMLLDLMVWNGAPLGLLIFGVLVFWFWRQLRACTDTACAYLLGSLLVVFTHAAFEYPLSYAYFLVPAGLMMGAVDGLSPVNRGVSIPRWLNALLAAFATAATVLIAVDYLKVDADHRKMRLEKFIIHDRVQAESSPEIRLLTNWRDFLVLARNEARPGMPAELVETMRKVYLRHPQPPILMRYALVAGLNGRPDDARAALATLCKIHLPVRCQEGRDGWLSMQHKHPQLPHFDWPPDAFATVAGAR
jgi:O-antigen ligase